MNHLQEQVTALIDDLLPAPTPRAAELSRIAATADAETLVEIATDPETHAATLYMLTKHSSPEVRAATTDNFRTPDLAWTCLATDESEDVKIAVATNLSSTHMTAARYLAGDEDSRVIRALAENENTPIEVLGELISAPVYIGAADAAATAVMDQMKVWDEGIQQFIPEVDGLFCTGYKAGLEAGIEGGYVISDCLGSAPTPKREETVKETPQLPEVIEDVLETADETRATREEALRELASDPDWELRFYCAHSWDSPDDVILKLCTDQHPKVRQSALTTKADRFLTTVDIQSATTGE